MAKADAKKDMKMGMKPDTKKDMKSKKDMGDMMKGKGRAMGKPKGKGC